MTAPAFSPYHMLTDAQKLRVWEIWKDPTQPTEFVYQLDGGQVIGRASLLKTAKGKAAQFSEFDYGLPPALPAPVAAASRPPEPVSRRDVMTELPQAMVNKTRTKPHRRLTLSQIERNLEYPYPGAHGRKRKRGLGAALIHMLAVALYNGQKGSPA